MAYEDWTSGWTEVDDSGDLTVASNQITVSSLTDNSACVYKNFGSNYFSGEFTHYIDFMISADAGCVDGIISYSKTAHWTYADLGGGGVCIYAYNLVSDNNEIYIEKSGSGNLISANLAADTRYYMKIVRDASNVITCSVYSDAAHANLIGSASVTDATAFDYISCAWEGYNDASWSGVLYNLDIGSVLVIPDPYDTTHTHSTDSPALSQTHISAPSDSLLAHGAESPAILQTHLIGPVESLLAHSAEQAVLLQTLIADPLDTLHGHVADEAVAGEMPLLIQDSFRFVNDDGDEDASSFAGDLNADIGLAPDDVFRIRFLINGAGDPASSQFQLEYRYKPSGGEFGAWSKVT